MKSKELIENVLQTYQYDNFPVKYQKVLVDVISASQEELADNLLSITLGGSGGKNNIIPGWSDLDIYIVLRNSDIEQINNLRNRLANNKIHIGLTFYDLYELENNLIDFKTKIMIYEKHNYQVNPTLYGNDYFQDVSYQEVYENDLLNYPHILQMFKRMYLEVLNNERKIDKTYVKKMLVLVKCILSSQKIFVYGYKETFEEYFKIIYNNDQVKFNLEVLSDLENNQEYFLGLSHSLISYTDNEEVFKKNSAYRKIRKLQVS